MYQQEHEEEKKQKIEEEKQRIEEEDDDDYADEEEKKIENVKGVKEEGDEEKKDSDLLELYPEYNARRDRLMRFRIKNLERQVRTLHEYWDMFFKKEEASKEESRFAKYNPFSQKYKGKTWKEYFEDIKKEESK
jgi:hypothetical protein